MTRGVRPRTASTAGSAAVVALLMVGASVVAQPGPDLVQDGKRLFVEAGCYGCHAIGRTGTEGMGPNLTRIGAKYDRAYLTRWLEEPAWQKPTAHMPKIELNRGEVAALAAYLSSLR